MSDFLFIQEKIGYNFKNTEAVKTASVFLELLVGLEPTACALRMRCSTN